MFSRRTVLVVCIIVVLAISIIGFTLSSRQSASSYGTSRVALTLIAPFQKAVTHTTQWISDVWRHYFYLVSVVEENQALRKSLSEAIEKNNQCREIEFSNNRLRDLLNFQKTVTRQVVAAEVIGRDPSPWFKTVIIDKGNKDGVEKGLPVVIPEGIAGQVMEVSSHYAKVLLVIDPNSAVDALVQRTRARGVVTGESATQCRFKYVLRKNEVRLGDAVVSSGLDGVFPKGLNVGHVSGIVRRDSGIFQTVKITPDVDFEKLEEVLVLLNPQQHAFQDEQ